jgi:hypothetical protein
MLAGWLSGSDPPDSILDQFSRKVNLLPNADRDIKEAEIGAKFY